MHVCMQSCNVCMYVLHIPLSVLLKNEAKGGDMIDITAHLHQFVLSVS